VHVLAIKYKQIQYNTIDSFINRLDITQAQKPVFIGIIFYCTYSFWGFAPRAPWYCIVAETGFLSALDSWF